MLRNSTPCYKLKDTLPRLKSFLADAELVAQITLIPVELTFTLQLLADLRLEVVSVEAPSVTVALSNVAMEYLNRHQHFLMAREEMDASADGHVTRIFGMDVFYDVLLGEQDRFLAPNQLVLFSETPEGQIYKVVSCPISQLRL